MSKRESQAWGCPEGKYRESKAINKNDKVEDEYTRNTNALCTYLCVYI